MYMTKEPRPNIQEQAMIDHSPEENRTNGVEEQHSIVNNEIPQDGWEHEPVVIVNSVSSDEGVPEDDKPLAERFEKLNAMKLQSPEGGKKTHNCQICHKIFNRKSRLTSHMIKHNDSRPYRCVICSKNFKTHSYMMRHMEIHYEPKQMYTCGVCNFKAKSKPYLKVHYIRQHTDVYRFSCAQCGKMFKLKSDHTVHVRGHEMDSCVCDICGSTHPNKTSLYHHRQYRHSTIKKPYQCRTCKKRFSTMKNLKSHGKLHDMKYVCEQCGMEFKRRYGLTKHMRTHSTEKKCLCAICGKTFKSLSAQKVHLLTHVGERPYVCDMCGKSFTQRSPMMLHRRTKHPEIQDAPPPIKITDLLHGVKDKIIKNNIID